MALDTNNSGTRTPYTPPTIEEIAIDMCDMNNPHQRPIYKEYQRQTTVASLATRYEIKTALADIMGKPRVVHNTQGGVKRRNGTPVNTMVHLLEEFAEKNPITQAELQRGFPDLKSLQVAKNNANNSRGSTFRDHRLELTTESYLKEPDQSEWQLRSSEVGWVRRINGDLDRAPVTSIYADATKIKDNDSLFIDSPRFSQFIFGALTDLSHGATLEEFSVVTGLSEDEILRTISNINESIIPSSNIDLKIHNRNGILIFGRKGRKLQFVSSLGIQVVTLKWKTLVAEMRDRIKEIMAREPAELETKLTELEAELTALKEKIAQIRAIAARNASHETREIVTAEFEPTIKEQKAEIKRLKSLETSLTSRNQHLQTLLRRPASEQAAEIQRELEKTQRDLAKTQADLEKAKATTASPEALASAQREIAELKTKLETSEKAKTASSAIEIAQKDLTITTLRDQLEKLKRRLEESRRIKDEPIINWKEISAEERAAAEAKVAATLKKTEERTKAKEKDQALKDLTEIAEMIESPDTKSVSLGIFDGIITTLNNLEFSEESLTAFAQELSEIEKAITENNKLSRERQTQQTKIAIQSVQKFIKGVLSTKTQYFSPERKSLIIRQIQRIQQLQD